MLPVRVEKTRQNKSNWKDLGTPTRAGTPITFQRGLNPNVNPDGPTQERIAASAPFIVKNVEKDGIAMEQYGAVVSLLWLETIDAEALPRSNQIAATLFDKGHGDTNGE